MKVKLIQAWKKVDYGDKLTFSFWSPKIRGKGDRRLAKSPSFNFWKKINLFWKKVVVLKPTGDPETTFSIGFASIFGDTKISSVQRKVKDGPFGLRMGPEDCEFFIASNEEEIGLVLVEHTTVNNKKRKSLQLY